MFKNYLKIAWRNLLKNKGFTIINILGLMTGFAISLLIAVYASYEFSYEDNHLNAERIVRITTDYLDGETVTAQDCETFPPVGPKIKAEIPQVEEFTRAYQIGEPSVNVRVGNKSNLVDRVYAVDPGFFDIFTSPVLYGTTRDIFNQPGEAVLTESTAMSYFNRKDVVGELFEMRFAVGTTPLKIVAVVADSPPNTHLKYDLLISYPTLLSDPVILAEHRETEDNWNGNNTYLYVLLNEQTDFATFETALAGLTRRIQDEHENINVAAIGQPITDVHLYSKKSFEPEINGDATSVYFLLIVALFVIISAFVNYTNLATSKALDRAREVGIRKVAGSTIWQLRSQFLIESLLVTLIAAVCAVTLIWLLQKPFIALSGLPEGFEILTNPFFWQLLVLFTVAGVLLSGTYPAIVLSSFKPASVLKGNFSHSSGGVRLRKALVIIQFTITVVLLIQTFIVSRQLDHIRQADLGVNTDNTIVIKAPTENDARQNYAAFKKKVLSRSDVQQVAISASVPGQMASQMSTTTGINLSEKIEDNNFNFYLTEIDQDYIPVMGVQFLAGSNFSETSHQDNREVIVNEEAIRLWGISDAKDAVGRRLRFWGAEWTIRGVVKNYHQESAKAPFIPMIHRYTDYFGGFASVKFTDSSPKEQIAWLREIYRSIFPNAAFSYFFMDEEYDRQYRADERFQAVFTVLTGFSILIACLGLFGLALFVISKRTKEIGIRKVVGASVLNILALLSNGFLKTITISVLIGVPITYWIARNWLDNFPLRIELSWWLFVLPVVLIFALVLFTVGINAIRTAIANPVSSLRTE